MLNGAILGLGGHGLELYDRMGKQCSTLAGDAAVDEESPESGEAAAELGARVKSGGKGGEFLVSGLDFEEEALIPGVEEAKIRMRIVADHGAAAIVGSAEMTATGIFCLSCGTARRIDLRASGPRTLLEGEHAPLNAAAPLNLCNTFAARFCGPRVTSKG